MFKPSPNPEGCVGVDEHERRLVALADSLEERGRKLLASDGRIDVATANQLALAAIKARSAAANLAADRIERDHDRWIMDEARKLRGGDVGADRPRLKRKAPL